MSVHAGSAIPGQDWLMPTNTLTDVVQAWNREQHQPGTVPSKQLGLGKEVRNVQRRMSRYEVIHSD